MVTPPLPMYQCFVGDELIGGETVMELDHTHFLWPYPSLLVSLRGCLHGHVVANQPWKQTDRQTDRQTQTNKQTNKQNKQTKQTMV